MVGDDAHAGLLSESPLRPLGKPKPDAVISAHCVAAGEDKASGLGRTHGFSLADELVHNLAVRVDHRHHQRHLPEGVGGATEAGIEGANHGLDAVESARVNLPSLT